MICPFCDSGRELRDMVCAWLGDDGHTVAHVELEDVCCETAWEWLQEDWDREIEEYDDVRRVTDAGVVDYQLQLQPVAFRDARAFVEENHGHTATLTGWKCGVAVWNGRTMIGVGVAGRPVSRVLQARGYWEITRVCVRRDLPDGLTWNACSMLYGALCREIRRQGGTRVCTYVLETEPGVTVRAAGFTQVAHVPARKRGWRDGRPTTAKWRWEKTLTRGRRVAAAGA